MPKLSPIKARRLVKLLQDKGFYEIRQKGSHKFFLHHDGRTTVVPNHPGEEIDRHLINKIIKYDLRMAREEFMKLLD